MANKINILSHIKNERVKEVEDTNDSIKYLEMAADLEFSKNKIGLLKNDIKLLENELNYFRG